MGSSKCLKCSNTFFEMEPARIKGIPYSAYFIQCASCGSVVSLIPGFDVPALIFEQNKALKAIAARVGASVQLQS